MHHVADMDADADLDLPWCRLAQVAVVELRLHFNGATHRRQRAGELDEETVADGFDFLSLMLWENRAEQAPMLLQQFQGERLVALRQRAVADHVVNMIAASLRCSVPSLIWHPLRAK